MNCQPSRAAGLMGVLLVSHTGTIDSSDPVGMETSDAEKQQIIHVRQHRAQTWASFSHILKHFRVFLLIKLEKRVPHWLQRLTLILNHIIFKQSINQSIKKMQEMSINYFLGFHLVIQALFVLQMFSSVNTCPETKNGSKLLTKNIRETTMIRFWICPQEIDS